MSSLSSPKLSLLIDRSSLYPRSLDLPAEGATLRQPSQTTSGLAEHHVAIATEHDRLGMAVDRGDLQAARALHVHEEAVGRLDHPLQLVLGPLLLDVRVQQVDVHGVLPVDLTADR